VHKQGVWERQQRQEVLPFLPTIGFGTNSENVGDSRSVLICRLNTSSALEPRDHRFHGEEEEYHHPNGHHQARSERRKWD
jgi:hypothetical protein